MARKCLLSIFLLRGGILTKATKFINWVS